ncbi:hypothetical protein PAECIP111802_01326 [Paenibacillus allorhizosphaerae]|uniref:Uncharacterized protein n=1 Tax=Paenibacillus allorhizosphaerae TaxID=2849866 RepID=A0ABN7TE56_9BACL|nr:hypothetical protein PAECIP111802_01326 [Paenibacillus allorhizosphaerae]
MYREYCGGSKAIVVFWSLSILLIVAFSFTRRRLHLFEGIVQWCFLLCLQNNFIWLMCLNLKLVELSQNLLNYWAFDSIRSVIAPLAMIYFLELNDGLNSVWTKAICWAGMLAAMIMFIAVKYRTNTNANTTQSMAARK